MKFPKIAPEVLLKRLASPMGKVNMVLDTDTYNEVDDQFALVYALKSVDRLNVQAVYAAPFYNEKSDSPEDGMEKSYDEILKILKMLEIPDDGFVFRGSTDYLKDYNKPQISDAAKDLVERAMLADIEPLYVVAIGAITNVASAILLEPKIIEKIVVIWLGGNALNWPHNNEFNLEQDVLSSQLIFDCGVPLIHIPCNGVTTHLLTTISELKEHLQNKSQIADYLIEIVENHTDDSYAWSKVIWDIATIAWLINPNWVPSNIVHSPILTENKTWSIDNSRHFIRSAYYMDRDLIYRDLFTKLSTND